MNENGEPITSPKDKLYKTLNNEPLLAGISLDDILFRCGELQLSPDDVCNLCAEHIPPAILRKQLNDPQNANYITYMRGVSEGKLNLNITLEANLSEPKVKDAYKALSAERRCEAINRKLEELF